jgi:hypothetical protein
VVEATFSPWLRGWWQEGAAHEACVDGLPARQETQPRQHEAPARLFASHGLNRVDSGGAERGQRHGGEGHGQQHRGDGDEGERVGGADAVEQACG